MNNAELVWRLVEMLLQKEKQLNQLTIDLIKKNDKSNVQKQDEV